MTFCYSPWTNIDISPRGDITPCCKFQEKNRFNIQTSTLIDYANSQFVKNIKEQFLNKQWPAGCERCRIEEDNGIESKRILDYNRWKDYYKQINLADTEFLTASIAFGNTCNLTCITCGPASSSRWQQEYRILYGIDKPPYHFYKQEFVQDFINHAPGIIHLDIPGGEPFLSGVAEQKKLLEHYIQTGQSKDISIHYTTNVTIYPDSEWWKLWQHFKEIDMQLSIDGVGTRYEYIRYPANWNTVLENTNKYLDQQLALENFRLSVSHTVSAYNIYYLDEFFEWCYNIGLPRPWLGKVHDPVHMRPGVWCNEAKQLIVDKLSSSSYKDANVWSNLVNASDDSKHYELFLQRLHAHDQYRGTNFKQTFPELAAYV